MTDATGRHIRAATFIWISSVMLSRVAGLLREIIIAHVAGANGRTDVYFTSFTLPDFVNYLLAGSALSITFIPIFTSFLLRGEDEEGWRVFSNVMTVIGLALVTLISLAWIFAGPLCRLLASGFSPEKHALLVRYTRILLPAQLFFFLGGLFGAVQMARGRHWVYALAPIIYNGGIIAGGLVLGSSLSMEGFCWGALGGALLGHGLLQVWGAAGVGMKLRLHVNWRHPAFRQFMLLSLPFMIGQSILLADDWLVRYFGSHLTDASISWLNYAKKLALVLPAVLGQAAVAASFPTLARHAEAGRLREMTALLRGGFSRALLYAALGAALLAVLSREATFIAFGRGRFTTLDTLTTARALAILAITVPAWVAQNFLTRGYYALRDTWTPTIIGTAITLAGVWLYGFMARVMENHGGGYLGLALASAISIVVYSLALYIGLTAKLRKIDPGALPVIAGGFVLRSAGLVVLFLIGTAALRAGVGAVWPDMTLGQCLLRSAVVGPLALVLFAGFAPLFRLKDETGLTAVIRRIRRPRA